MIEILCVCFSAGFALFSTCQSKKEKLINILITVVGALFCMEAFRLVLKAKATITEYEILALGTESAAIICFFILPLLRKQKCSVDFLLKNVCIVSVIAAVYSACTLGQAVLHSDTATAILLARSQIESKSLFPANWFYVNDEIWVLSLNLLAVLPTLLIKDQVLARAITSASCILIVCASIVWFSKKLFHNRSWTLMLPLFFVFLSLRWYAQGDMILYQAAYTSQIMWIALSQILFFFAWKEAGKSKWTYVLGYFVLMVLLTMSGARMLAVITLPECLCVIIFSFREYVDRDAKDLKELGRNYGLLLLLAFLPALVGTVIYKLLCAHHMVASSYESSIAFVGSLELVCQNIIKTIQDIYQCFGYAGDVPLFSVYGLWNFVSVAMCTIVCFVVPILQAKKLKEESAEVQFFFTFGMLQNMLMLILAVFFDKAAQTRYLLTFVIIMIMISSRYIYVYWLHQKSLLNSSVWTVLFTIATAIECMALIFSGIGWNWAVAEKRAFADELLSTGAKKAYATFWNAYNNEIYTDCEIRFGGINPDTLGPYGWLVDTKAYSDVDGKSILLLSEEENETVQEKIPALFGEPESIEVSSGYVIRVFSYDIGSRILAIS